MGDAPLFPEVNSQLWNYQANGRYQQLLLGEANQSHCLASLCSDNQSDVPSDSPIALVFAKNYHVFE